ncbi:MAG: hypothetical protein QW292_09680 [Candidatus Parvarchaeota archaeon]
MDNAQIPVHQLNSSIEKVRELGLVKTRVGNRKYPPRNLLSLTPTGRKIAKKIKEIQALLG